MKAKIPSALRQQVWNTKVGKKYEAKCKVTWCKNRMTVFDFHCGHNIPESKGGSTSLDNLIPICANCNQSMGNTSTIYEWNEKYAKKKPWWRCF